MSEKKNIYIEKIKKILVVMEKGLKTKDVQNSL